MGTLWIQGCSIATCDACDRVISRCMCDFVIENQIFDYAQANYENGWDIICEGFTHEELKRFVYECHKGNKPASFIQALGYVKRLVTAHNDKASDIGNTRY